jgi:hypothetical protein
MTLSSRGGETDSIVPVREQVSKKFGRPHMTRGIRGPCRIFV